MYKRFDKRGADLTGDHLLNQVLWMNGILRKEDMKKLTQKVSPYKLEGTKEFIKEIDDIISNRKKVIIVGDYDVDGVCATAIMILFFRHLGINHEWIVPNRFTDGYGLKVPLVERAINMGADVIITVDNGIKSREAISYAVKKGVEVIVTDHHSPDFNDFPDDAKLVINPHVRNAHLEFKEISGAMVAMNLVYHYFVEKNETPKYLLYQVFEICAIATVADVMPLYYMNRAMVQFFVKSVRDQKVVNKGINELIALSGVDHKCFNSLDIGYIIGPMLNAPGRLDSADACVKLLVSRTSESAKYFAEKCFNLNVKRKEETAKLMKLVKLNEEDSVHVVYLPNANEGIIGIVSGNITEKTGRPSFVFTDTKGGYLKGSGRSPENYNLIEGASDVLEIYPELTLGYGGHAGAMGLSIKDVESLEKFKVLMNENYNKANVEPMKKYYLNFYKDKDDFGSIYNKLEKLEPYGQNLEMPIFRVLGFVVGLKVFGDKHTSFAIRVDVPGEKPKYLNFVYFNKIIEKSDFYEIIFTLNKEHYNGHFRYKAFVRDMKKYVKGE